LISIATTCAEVSAFVAICPYAVSAVIAEPAPETAIIAEITVDIISHLSYLIQKAAEATYSMIIAYL